MSKPLISEAYRAQQRKLHENPAYGVASVKFAPLVAQVIPTVIEFDSLLGIPRVSWI